MLLALTLEGNLESKLELEEAFRKYFFRIRFIGYIVSTIKFRSIDQMRRYQKYKERNVLVFDRPVSQDSEATTLGELYLQSSKKEPIETYPSDPDSFQTSMRNELLDLSFSMLSSNQKIIVTFCYALSYQDNEIAHFLKISPQAVSKSRNTALKKLRFALAGRG
jgi:RNA polymerase sigma factor (sigma-70 family)